MACRRSQVRSLSGPPFETIRTRRKAGFLLYTFAQSAGAFWRARRGIFARRWQAHSAPLKAQEGALQGGLEPQSKNAERRVFCCVLSRRVQARSAPLKAQEVALRCGLEPQSKNAERRVFCCVLSRRVQARFGARGGVFLRGAAVLGARRWQVRSAPLKAGKVCAPVISP